ncbi:MAG: 3-oxoacyl-ACP synthase III [Deltaproteobacteria bacterium]|nr:3-oxoacyl-ACP synthase III [Deltaproteobacteria bacterium]
MRYERVFLDTLAFELAPMVVSTAELEDRLAPAFRRLHIQPGQVEALTGIRERRFWAPGTKVSEGAIKAARRALADSPVSPEDLGALIFAGVCRDEYEPATATHVAAEIGVHPRAMVYDLSNACLGVLNGILDLANRIELGQIRAGMVVSCESAREIVDEMISAMLAQEDPDLVVPGEVEKSLDAFRLGLATLTGGSGAIAVIVTDGSFAPKRRRLVGGVNRNAPEHHLLCRWGVEKIDAETYRPYMRTDSVKVLEHGVALGRETFRDFLAELSWTQEAIDRVICHQVGAAHQAQILKTLEIPPEKDFATYGHLGNMGTVALPAAAALAERRGFLAPGQRVAFLGIGSGLNCTMLGIEW